MLGACALALLAANGGCSGASPQHSGAAILPPASDLGGSYASPAAWRYHPEQQAHVEAREELPDGRVLSVGKRGERWLYDPRSKQLQAGASLAPEDLVAVLRGPDGGFWFVGRSGTSYEARDPLGVFVRSSAPFDRLAQVAAARGVMLGVRVDRHLLRSADAGASWLPVGPEGAAFVDVAMARDGSALALALPEKLWASADAGQTFAPLDVAPQGTLALERDPAGEVRLLTPLGALRWVPGGSPPVAPAPLAQVASAEMGKPPRGPNAGALAEGRAVIAAGEYLEADQDDEAKRSWRLLRGRLDGALESAPLAEARGCRALRLAAFGRYVTLACFRGSAENASQPIELYRSETGGTSFEREPYAAFASLAAFRMTLSARGNLIVTGICPAAVSGSGCAPSGLHYRRMAKPSTREKKSPKARDGAAKSEPSPKPKSDAPSLELGAAAAPSLVDSALALGVSTDGKLVYALGRSGKTGQLALFISKDTGKSFEPEQLDLSGARDADYGDSSDGTRADALVPAEDGTVAIALSRYRSRTLVVTDELGRVLSVTRPPEEPALLGAAGTRALAVAPGNGQVWESLDGGATWEPSGRLPIDLCSGDEQCDVPLQCAPEGCVIGHELSRIGWGGQADEELGVLAPEAAAPSEALERRVRTPIECALAPAPFKALPGVRELPDADSAAIGKAAWFAPGSDPDQAAAFVYHGLGGAKPHVETVTLLPPTPRASGFAFYVTSQIEGAAALRYPLPSIGERKLVNVELGYDNLFENRVVLARLRDAGTYVSGDFTREQGVSQTARPNLLSIAEGGIYLRAHASLLNRQPTYFLDAQSSQELPPIPWPSAVLRAQDRPDMARLATQHLGLLAFGQGAAWIRARFQSGKWSFDAGVTGLADPASFGLTQRSKITYLDNRAALYVELADEAGRSAAAQIFPLRADGAVLGAPLAAPTQLDLGPQPQACGSAERSSSARVVASNLPGTRHPVLITDAVDPPRVMITGFAVLHGSPQSPCAAAFDAVPVANDSGGRPSESAIIVLDDLEHAWLFRQIQPPGNASLRVEYRSMSCRFSPGAEVPPELYRESGTLAPRRR